MKRLVASVVTFSLFASLSFASSQPVRGRNGMVVSQKMLASEAGLGVLRDGGSAVDAAVATALALAVTLPCAGNIGGGGFMVFRSGDGEAITYDFREAAPAAATATGGGFLLNSELGDFNAASGLTNTDGLLGTAPNLAAPGKSPLSSMSPTIVVKDGELFLVTGSPGGRTIINTVVQTILHTVDFGLNAQEAIDAGRLHHQWLPDKIRIEKNSFSPDTLAILRAKGHAFQIVETLGCAQIILYDREDGVFQGGSDLRRRDGGVAAY